MTSVYAAVLSALVGVVLSAPVDDKHDLTLQMPDVQPKVTDAYLCNPQKLDSEHPLYLTGFKPHANMSFAHHVLIYGCAKPGFEDKTWDCGEMATSSASDNYESGPVCADGAKIIYAWAMDAPAFKLPKDTAFKVGGDTDIQWLVLQVHYKDVTPFNGPENAKDHTSVDVSATTTPQPKMAGVYLLGTGGEIAPKSTVYMEAACSVNDPVEIHPFAYRVHAHTHGEVVTGYRVRDGKWTELGREDPKKPEMFYPVTTPDVTVEPGDVLAARCTMVNKEDRTVRVGNTQNDEMCNFYLMYWVEGDQTMKDNYCFTQGPPKWSWDSFKGIGVQNVPQDASLKPGMKQAFMQTTQVQESSNMDDLSDKEKEEFVELIEELLGDEIRKEEELQQELQMPYGYGEDVEQVYEPELMQEYPEYNPTYQRTARGGYRDQYDELLRDIEAYYDNLE